MIGVSPAARALPDFVAVRQGVGRPQVDSRRQEGGVRVAASAAVVAVRAHNLISVFIQVVFVLECLLLTFARVPGYVNEIDIPLMYFNHFKLFLVSSLPFEIKWQISGNSFWLKMCSFSTSFEATLTSQLHEKLEVI